MTGNHRFRFPGLTLFVVVLTLAVTASAEWKEKVLYSFQGGSSDGSVPAGGVVFDKHGNLYGATTDGGRVYQLTPPAKKDGTWTENVLYVFQGNTKGDGSSPSSGLVIDRAGNLYGVTAYGGTGNCVLLGTKVGCGTVYELSPPAQPGGQWTETILYSFQSGKDGYLPQGNLVFDKKGNLYGATVYGGGYGSCNAPYYPNCGTVFELSPPKQKGGQWTEQVLYSFKGISNGYQTGDGANPNGGLVIGSTGAVYGTTYYGGNEAGVCKYGSGGIGCGTIFELVKRSGLWSEKVYRFNGLDGDNPAAGLTLATNGELYGTTQGGTVFRVVPPSGKLGSWRKTTLYTFNGCDSGCDPEGAVNFDHSGNLYGTTYAAQTAYGTVFRLKHPTERGRSWVLSVLYGFAGPPDGGQPAAALIFDKNGNLYSTTTKGGSSSNCINGCGTVFELQP